MAFKTEYTAIATLLAAASGVVFAVVLWFVLTRFFAFEGGLASVIASIIGGIEFLVLRYVLSQKYIVPDDKL